jgi:GDP-L-fucose synthase
MIDLQEKKVMVTGGSSMIGRCVVKALERRKAIVLSPTHIQLDLLDYSSVMRYVDNNEPEYLIHCAGWNGGLKWNLDFPADIFYKTSIMGLHVLTAAHTFRVKKAVSIISSCALPDKGQEILNAEELWQGAPNKTVECHGLSKRILDAYSRQLFKQFKHNYVCAILTNCYGPFDSFHPEKTKVVGAIVKRVVDAYVQNLPEIVCWGSGEPKRELMYCDDAGDAIVQTLEKYDDPTVPINLGTGEDISIKNLTERIVDIVGYKGQIKWDTSKPDGQMKKLLNTDKMREILNVKITPSVVGLANTVRYYKGLLNGFY